MKHGDSRNQHLIRNLIGRQAHEWVVHFVENVHESGAASFPERAAGLFSYVSNNVRRTADVSVWVVRVLPDDAAAWMKALVAEYDRVKNQNSIHVHAMLIALMETTAAFAALPTNSSEDGAEYERNIHGWLAKLLLDGKTKVLLADHKDALARAIKAFTKHHLSKYRICDAMQTIIAADDKYLWVEASVTEFALRAVGEAMVSQVYDQDEIIFALSRYREGRRY